MSDPPPTPAPEDAELLSKTLAVPNEAVHLLPVRGIRMGPVLVPQLLVLMRVLVMLVILHGHDHHAAPLHQGALLNVVQHPPLHRDRGRGRRMPLPVPHR